MILYYALLAVLLGVVSYYDLRSKKIKNLWSLGTLAFFPIFFVVSYDSYQWGLQHFFLPFLSFSLGFFLFRARLLGAGDSKFLTAFLLVIPYSLQIPFLVAVLLLTGVVGFFWVAAKFARPFLPVPLGVILVPKGDKLPYAPIYLVGWLWVVVEHHYFS